MKKSEQQQLILPKKPTEEQSIVTPAAITEGLKQQDDRHKTVAVFRKYNELKKVSELFYKAAKQNIRQIKGAETHSSDGLEIDGYCAIGLLAFNYGISNLDVSRLNGAFVKKYGKFISEANDRDGWTFKGFGDAFAHMGL